MESRPVVFRVLGTVEVVEGSAPLALGGPKHRKLVAVLLANRGRVVGIERLMEILWDDAPPPTARPTLQTHISKLRRLLVPTGAALVNRPPGYVLDVPPGSVDADQFEAGIRAARATAERDPHAAAGHLDRVLGLWRGPAYAEFRDAPWASPEATRLEEMRLVALEERTELALASGQAADLVGELEGRVRAHPLRERSQRQLMVALHRAGRQAEALRAGQAYRSHLRDDLGLDPSDEFCAVEGAIAAAPASSTSGEPRRGRTCRGQPDVRPSVPAGRATELVGREAELDDLRAACVASRLVTLTGTGGVGKSRLAFELARSEGGLGLAHGVRLVELAAVRESAAVVAAIGAALDVEQRPGRSLVESLLDVLGPLELLLVLDNCEHVIDAVADLVSEIIQWCPGVRVLATSREPLGMPGELVRPVRPLAVPPADAVTAADIEDFAAVQVFMRRSAEASEFFSLSDATAPTIAALCIRLDGLPLALELAAARMASMTPAQLLERLTQRFVLLASGRRTMSRHRTLRDVVQWSYGLLDPDERAVFAQLSVFAGGFDLPEAERTCTVRGGCPEQIARLVADLVDKSLVVAEASRGNLRYRQLETLRQFGAERLAEQGETAQLQRRHTATFIDLAARGAVALDGPEEGAWMQRFERDFDNLRVAVETALERADVDSALRIVDATQEFAFRRIRYEVIGWAEAAAAAGADSDHDLLPVALATVGYGSFVRGELERAVEHARLALAAAAARGLPSSGLAERVLGNALFYQGERTVSLEWMDRMVEAATQTGEPGRIAHAYYMRSVAQTSIGDPAGGRELARRAMEAAERAQSGTASSQALYAAGLATAGADVDRAVDLLSRSAASAEEVGNRWMRAFALTEALWLRAGRGEHRSALRGYREVVEIWYRGGDWANQWLSLRQLAGILVGIGRDHDAALLLGAVEAAGARAALPFASSDADRLAELAQSLERRLGPSVAAETRRRGASMRDEVVVRWALDTIAATG